MRRAKVVIDGVEQNLTHTTIDDTVTGWFKVHVKMWNSTVYLFVGSIDELIKSGRVRFKDNPEVLEEIEHFQEKHPKAFAAVRLCGLNDFIIRLNSFRPCLIDDMLTLCHESLHVAQVMLYNVGAEVEPAGSETLAYTHGHIFGRLIQELLKGCGGRSAGKKSKR